MRPTLSAHFEEWELTYDDSVTKTNQRKKDHNRRKITSTSGSASYCLKNKIFSISPAFPSTKARHTADSRNP